MFEVIGEKINGTRKTVGTAVVERNAELIQSLAVRQAEAGASWIDVNAGTGPTGRRMT
jgi:5-methyltetrahydrofolate--homocysteine methyltransferase